MSDEIYKCHRCGSSYYRKTNSRVQDCSEHQSESNSFGKTLLIFGIILTIFSLLTIMN